jgi:type I restriction enzyme R subunit
MAVADKAVVPLIYEGRHVSQSVHEQALDRYFEKIAQRDGLTQQQQADLKKKFARADQLNSAQQKIYAIAWDISSHFQETRQ